MKGTEKINGIGHRNNERNATLLTKNLLSVVGQ
jgi:hypothetical protein